MIGPAVGECKLLTFNGIITLAKTPKMPIAHFSLIYCRFGHRAGSLTAGKIYDVSATRCNEIEIKPLLMQELEATRLFIGFWSPVVPAAQQE
jgi:hypothetical protein